MSETTDATSATDEQEFWLDIPDMIGFYQASSWGRIRSLPRATTSGVVLKLNTNRQGYFLVTPCVRGVITTRQVSGLVCLAFHGPRPADKDLVAHGDGNHQNNRYTNLRWATFIENEDDKRRHGREASGERNPACKLTEKQVAEIRETDFSRHGSVVGAAQRYGCSTSLIHQIRNNQVWSDEGNHARRVLRRSSPKRPRA